MTRHVRLGELLIAHEGLAILRHLLRGVDEDVRARIQEVADICARIDEEPYSTALPVPEMDPVEGYTAWSSTYDAGGNPLIDLEEPVVRGIIERLPKGRAVDLACGTGRHTQHLLDSGHDVVGIDLTEAMLRRAR